MRRAQYGMGDFAYGEGVFVRETSQVDKWWQQASEQPRPLKRLPLGDFATTLGVFVTETAQLDKWYTEDIVPQRNRARTWLGDFGFGEGVFTSPAVGVDSWEHFYSDYLRPLPRLTDRNCLSYGEGVFVKETTGVDKWEHFYPDYLRRSPWLSDRNALSFGEGVFNAESITLDKWWQTASLPVRPSYRVAPWARGTDNFQAVFVAAFNPATGFPYEQSLDLPRPLPHRWLGDYATTLGVFVTQTTTLDKWWQPASLPVAAAKRTAPYTFNVTTTEIISLDKWYQPASLPVTALKRMASMPAGGDTFVITFSPATGFPWEQASEPPRPLRKLWLGDYASQLFVTPVNPAAGYPWEQASEPRRALQRIPYDALYEVIVVTPSLIPKRSYRGYWALDRPRASGWKLAISTSRWLVEKNAVLTWGMTMPANLEMETYRGEDRLWTFVPAPGQPPTDITGWTLTATFFNQAVTPPLAVITKTTGGGGLTIVNGPAGFFTLTQARADTSALPPAFYPGDIWGTDLSGNARILATGGLTLRSSPSH